MRILVINGPNINMLGIREPDIYGRATYDDLVGYIRDAAAKRNVSVSFFQSNHGSGCALHSTEESGIHSPDDE